MYNLVVFTSVVVSLTNVGANDPKATLSFVGPRSEIMETVSKIDSIPPNAAEDTPLTVEQLTRFVAVKKAIDDIASTHPLDSLARARHLVSGRSFALSTEMSQDSLRRLQRRISVEAIAQLSMPELAPAFANTSMTPVEFFWVRRRLEFAFNDVKSASLSARITGQPLESMLALVPSLSGLPDADRSFVIAHEPEVRAALGFPARDAATTPTAHANPTVTLLPSGGALDSQLVREVAAARAAGQTPVVEIVDLDICGDLCVALDQALERPPLVGVFKSVRLIKVGYLVWHRKNLEPLKFCTPKPDGSFGCDMMHFVGVSADGHASAVSFTVTPDIIQDIKISSRDKAPDAMSAGLAPKFTTFLDQLRKQQ